MRPFLRLTHPFHTRICHSIRSIAPSLPLSMSVHSDQSAGAPIISSPSASTSAVDSSTPALNPQRVILVPGNGCSDVSRANWYSRVATHLRALGCDVRLETMPDPFEAKEAIWIPFIVDNMQADEHSIVIGHSSGAVAALRLLETHKLAGCILVSACHTDLGEESERISGYYSRPWNWDVIRQNAGWIVQFHSKDDHLIPVEEARFVAQHIQSEYIEQDGRGHYMDRDMPDVVDIVKKKCGLDKK